MRRIRLADKKTSQFCLLMIDFHVLPHEKAPLFANFNDASLIINQIIDEIQQGKPGNPKEIFEYVRQAGFVNLWFFLKFIAGVAGPFDFLNEGVHLDLCNFRQSEYCMKPGAHAAAFLPRGFCKTSIMTIGGSAWEALRNGDVRIRIINSVIDRAHSFKHTAQRIFDGNVLFAALYPEAVPARGARRWNDDIAVVAHAGKFFKEPTFKAGGASGSSEGDHHDVLMLDDLIGLDEVDDNFNPNQRMKTVASWLDTNMIALLVSPETSRVLVAATRYGRGDVYQQMWDDCRELVGYAKGMNVRTDQSGGWVIYYRHVIEDGKATNPFVMTVEGYRHLLKTKPLVAAFQYANNVDISINNELAQLATKSCRLVPVDSSHTDYLVERLGETVSDDDPWIELSRCHCCISVDWAGSDRRKSAATCRSSIGVWAMDWKRRCYRIDQFVGYYGLPAVFENLFALWNRYPGFILTCIVETNAMQGGIVQLLELEQERRGIWLNTTPVAAKGDKIVKIRSVLGQALFQGSIYLSDGASAEFTEERLSFPAGLVDVLDESEKAVTWLEPPESDEHRWNRETKSLRKRLDSMDNGFGY